MIEILVFLGILIFSLGTGFVIDKFFDLKLQRRLSPNGRFIYFGIFVPLCVFLATRFVMFIFRLT